MTYKPRLLGSITNQTGCSPNLIHPSMSLSTYPSGSFRKLERFEASTYSEVLKAVDMADNNKPVVMKIMRALSKGVIRRLPSVATRGCQSYNDILNELVVTQALSQLHEGVILGANSNSFYKTHFFCLIHEIKVVSGSLERTLSRSRASSASIVANTTESDDDKMADKSENGSSDASAASKVDVRDDELKSLKEVDRMLMEALPHEYVVCVMQHDGKPLWWMMTNKKLSAEQLTSVLVQVIVGLAIAEKVYLYEHRDLHVSNILIKKTSEPTIPFVLEGRRYTIVSHGIKSTVIDATFSRLNRNGEVYFRNLTSTLSAYGNKKSPTRMSLQNRSYRQMVQITHNNWEDFVPKTNLIWLTYLCETLMKSDIMKAEPQLLDEVKKIRDHSLKVGTTLELLSLLPFERRKVSRSAKSAN